MKYAPPIYIAESQSIQWYAVLYYDIIYIVNNTSIMYNVAVTHIHIPLQCKRHRGEHNTFAVKQHYFQITYSRYFAFASLCFGPNSRQCDHSTVNLNICLYTFYYFDLNLFGSVRWCRPSQKCWSRIYVLAFLLYSHSIQIEKNTFDAALNAPPSDNAV